MIENIRHSHILWQHYVNPDSSSLSITSITSMTISAFLGGLFAGIWGNFFEVRRKRIEIRREKYNEHRNAIVQIQHEIIPLRINLSRDLACFNEILINTNKYNTRIVLRLYDLNLNSDLSMKILSIDLINEYLDLITILESIKSDIQYLTSLKNNILENSNIGKNNESLNNLYPMVVQQLQKMCLKADALSLKLLSKCRLAINSSDQKNLLNKYISHGGEVVYVFTNKDIKKENTRTTRRETRPYAENEDREQFLAPYMDIKRINIP